MKCTEKELRVVRVQQAKINWCIFSHFQSPEGYALFDSGVLVYWSIEKVKVKWLSRARLFGTPWIVACTLGTPLDLGSRGPNWHLSPGEP